MRARFPFPFAALVIAVLAIAQAPPAHAVLVQGFEVTALGSADVAAVVTANSPPRRLVNSNIDASGDDGFTLPLYGGSGIVLTFEQPTSPAGDIERREFTLYVNGEFPGDKVPVIKGTALRTPTGSTREIHCTEELEYIVEVWSYGSRVRSVTVPMSTVVTLTGSHDVTAPGAKLLSYGAKTGKSGSVHKDRRVMMVETLPAPCDITIDGVTVAGDQLVFEVESDVLPLQFDSADMVLATSIAALLHGNVVIGDLTRMTDKHPATIRLSDDPIGDALSDNLHLLAEDAVAAITYSVDAAGPGGGGGGTVHVGTPVHRLFNSGNPQWVSRKWTIDLNPQTDFTVEMDVECDDGSGLPPATYTISAGAIATPTTQIAFSSTIPGDEPTVQPFSLGRPVGQPAAAGLGTHVQCSTAPIGVTATGTPTGTSIEYEFPPGTTFDMNGQTFFGNMLHMHSVSTHARRINDVRIVHNPSSPPGTWRLTNMESSNSPPAGETGGRDCAARGPRQTVSLDGTYQGNNKRLGIRDVCNEFKGQLKIALTGAPTLALEPRPEPGEPEPELSMLDLYECADTDGCDPSRSLEVTTDGVAFQVRAIFTDHSTPQFVEADRKMIPITVTEAQGGQHLVLTAASPIEPRVILKSYRWLSPHSECFTIEFSEPVQFSSALGTHVARKITFWTNPTSSPSGTPTQPPVVAISLNQLPPGTPWTEWWAAPPKVHTSGSETVRDAVPVTRGGQPVISTWGQADGGVLVTGEPDGKLTVTREWKHHDIIGLDAPVLEAVASDPACPGFVVETNASPPALVWSPRSNIFLYGNGRLAGQPSSTMLQGLEIESGGGSPPIVRYVAGALSSEPVEVHLINSATDVGSAPASEVTLNHTSNVIVVGDSDGDLSLGSFPPGTTATVAGLPPDLPVTRVTFHLSQKLAVAGYDNVELKLAGLPPGIPVMGTRISQIAAPGSTVDVPPAKPPIAGLELRGVMPNPARGASTVRLALGRESRIRVQVLDIAGREVARLADGVQPAGEHTLTWSGETSRGTKAAAGLYLVRVSGDGLATQITRMIRLD
jgi:hypothetical protein